MRNILIVVLLIVLALSSAIVLNYTEAQTRADDLGSPLNRPTLYGINTDLRSDLKTIRETGFQWVRVSINLDQVDWAATDAFITSASDNKLRVVAVLKGTPPINPNRFTSLVTEFAKRYGERIDHYQILDEPNLYSTWNANPNPTEYLTLLQASYIAIKKIDPASTVILGALAPTTEVSPKNISDIIYLKQLYDLGAKNYFDAAAGKPYGFNASPLERNANLNVLNFSRLTLLRQEMLAHNDGEKFLWASEFGWSNQPSIWGHVTPDQQIQYTREAYTRAQNEWAWSGPLFIQSPTSDLQKPFAINLQFLNLQPITAAASGTYTPQSLISNLYSSFTGNWKFSDLGADIPSEGEATLTINFIGDRLDATIRRGDYRGYLYVTVDGKPANALPSDLNGDAFVILTSPDLMPRTETITLAKGLTPAQHTAIIRAERGWDQWSLVSFTISTDTQRINPLLPLIGVSLVVLIGIVLMSLSRKFSNPAQSPLQWTSAIIVTALLWISAGLTWSTSFADSFRKYGDTIPLIATLLTASVFYYSPFLILTIVCAIILFILFYLRPDIALALIAFTIPFYLVPKNLWQFSFSMVEICTVLAFVASLLRYAPQIFNRLKPATSHQPLATSLDLAILSFVAISFISIYIAEIRGVAIREFRVIVIEPAMFYVMLRLIPLERKSIWRIVDAFVIGVGLVALIGYWDYFIGRENLITAENGLKRMVSVMGSPNNVGLLLGRALPITATIALLSRYRPRRIFYAVMFPFLLGAIVLSFSKGALILGVPISLAVIILFWGGRRAVIGLVGLAVTGAVAAIPLSQNPRFADTFNFTSGTSFFRIQLWRSVISLISDHPILGVGLDNFLYAYRGKYILPEAWQEPNLAHAHNVILDSFVRLGVFGFVSTVWMLSAFFLTAYTTLKRLTDPDLRALTIGLIASMIYALAHGMVDTGYWFVDLAFVFMMTMGLMKKLESED